MYKCDICNEVFDKFQQKGNHIRWFHNKIKFSESGYKKLKSNYDLRYGKFLKFGVECFLCKKEFFVVEREKKFPTKEKYYCSISCSNTRIHSQDTKDKISKSTSITIRKLLLTDEYVKKQELCHKKRRFNSKSEIEVRNYFMENYPNDEWTTGGGIRYNDIGVQRDLYSKKLKICVEYDGIWHFKDIHNQLKDKQLKDATLEQWCIENDYRLIRLKDELYISNKKLYLEKLIHAIYESKEQIIKFY